MKQMHLLIEGRVQGVAFRHYTQKRASELNLSGYVRNLADGRVEVVAEGSPESLEQLKRWCKGGPSAARVERINDQWNDSDGQYDGFNIRY